MTVYNSWPLGKLPKEFQRNEPELIRKDYPWNDPREIVGIFEKKVAKFAGSKYAVSVDCCTNAIFLSLKYLLTFGEVDLHSRVYIPRHTYCSVFMQLQHLKFNVILGDKEWKGAYQLYPTRVVDAAVRWTRGMYIPESLMCLSFQIKKRVPIGKGGMILTDDPKAYRWLKLASYDGRDLDTPYDSPGHVQMMGYHMYMTPEDAARGIWLMDRVPAVNEDQGGWQNYPDLARMVSY